MPNDPIPLELAAFLDSPAARATTAGPKDWRRFGLAILEACYESLGLAPRLLDGESTSALLRQALPARLDRGDAAAKTAEELLPAFFEYLRESEVVPQAFEIAQRLDQDLDAFLEAIRNGTGAPVAKKSDPFVHGAPKTGRNDPCFCGSGKKFKKCHGRA